MESRNKFYLYDRWFYIVKDTDKEIEYSSIPNNVLNGITLKLDKEKYTLTILCFKKEKMITKITTSSLKDTCIEYKYKEKEPQFITVNNNLYVNLFIEAKVKYESVRSIGSGTMIIKRKNIMNKICYLEPDFKVNEKMTIASLDIDSQYFNYFKNLCEKISISKNKFVEYIDTVSDKKEIIIDNDNYSITIPDEIYYYDRNYTLIKKNVDSAVYSNQEDGYNELKINFNPLNKTLTQIQLKLKEEKSSKQAMYELKIYPNTLNGVTSTFKSNTKKTMMLSNREIEDASFYSTLVFDDNSKLMSFNTKLTSKKTVYNLTISPVFRNVYSDEFGNEYHLIDRDYCQLLGIAKFAFWGYESTKKKFLTKN